MLDQKDLIVQKQYLTLNEFISAIKRDIWESTKSNAVAMDSFDPNKISIKLEVSLFIHDNKILVWDQQAHRVSLTI